MYKSFLLKVFMTQYRVYIIIILLIYFSF